MERERACKARAHKSSEAGRIVVHGRIESRIVGGSCRDDAGGVR